jgi:hypothetical protein
MAWKNPSECERRTLQMSRFCAVPILLSESEKDELEGLVRAHSTPQQLGLRARMILLAAAGMGVKATALELGVWRKGVSLWRQRWSQARAGTPACERLADAPRSGAPPTFTPEQTCAIMALACEGPAASGLPISQWSQSELARQCVARGIVKSILHGSVGRFLKKRPTSSRIASAIG